MVLEALPAQTIQGFYGSEAEAGNVMSLLIKSQQHQENQHFPETQQQQPTTAAAAATTAATTAATAATAAATTTSTAAATWTTTEMAAATSTRTTKKMQLMDSWSCWRLRGRWNIKIELHQLTVPENTLSTEGSTP
ncbi:uncharacterized protein LOC115925465 [Strongylocentrotus purpuratus]|uniref:Uncharacterized protein n=1 Tax=Strongylocentrotus purpuratus TaxID=7668 RepID=A0A7M7T0M9_STRPU|nr:uncharacterized protein LOC115925465 [Strongylocentrotus purpuratus]